ncbi:hypothetical protein SMC26_17090 [Actinomadura fulvescens]|uniref:Uncharacterized protein n=1 Tax=Actinomadura fulvescens TaxID=46160 RepID=A0ABN3QAA0_9ACTN
MTPQRWIILGWAFLTLAAILAIASTQQVFASLQPVPFRPMVLREADQGPQTIEATAFLRGVVLAVLSGAAFFSGLASFFWSAAKRRDDRLGELLERLPK